MRQDPNLPRIVAATAVTTVTTVTSMRAVIVLSWCVLWRRTTSFSAAVSTTFPTFSTALAHLLVVTKIPI
jgi:hypothetical protein